MGRVLRRRPSPAMIVALLALFVALGGSSYAAIKIGARNIKTGAVGSRAVANNSIRTTDIRNANVTGRDVRDDSLTNADIDNADLRARTATDADTLDGIDSSAFTRTSCAGQTGALKGVVTVAASAAFPGTFTPVDGYNCSGRSLEARRLSMGRYEVRFNGSPVTQAVATAVVAAFKADMVSVTNQGPGLFTVFVLDPLPAPGAFVDDPFTLITP